ncbi:hypothetical protein [Pseudomonas sp. P9(2020)]|uniref:hypothetical protein n=1 Tax=Pseudomonas sp. P9(2020) TaxID=2763316 RepID=UPI001B336CF2|nr:hypothetical protein [Pseudomonas sp. P9(2020)]MBP5948139.1 hypothetical protein [Pseudomonas sp. P9(2020)]
MQNFDLFGDAVEVINNSKPTTTQKPRVATKVSFDRRALWTDGGYLGELPEEEDDINIRSTECFTENATIERLEKALFMAPVVKNGEWIYDGVFWAYRVTKRVKGERQFGPTRTILRDATMYLVQASALKVLEASYKEEDAWLPKHAYWVFSSRLRMASDIEDPYELLKAFTAVMTQQDFLDASRKGDTVRNLVKRERMREQRASSTDDVELECAEDNRKSA